MGTTNHQVTLYVQGTLGDVNLDGIVNCTDYLQVQGALGSVRGDSRYKPNLDTNNDGLIDGIDLANVAKGSGTCY